MRKDHSNIHVKHNSLLSVSNVATNISIASIPKTTNCSNNNTISMCTSLSDPVVSTCNIMSSSNKVMPELNNIICVTASKAAPIQISPSQYTSRISCNNTFTSPSNNTISYNNTASSASQATQCKNAVVVSNGCYNNSVGLSSSAVVTPPYTPSPTMTPSTCSQYSSGNPVTLVLHTTTTTSNTMPITTASCITQYAQVRLIL